MILKEQSTGTKEDNKKKAYGAAELAQRLGDAVALDGGADLLRAGRDVERRLGLDAVGQRLAHDRRAPAHVFVARVGAAADQAHLSADKNDKTRLN